MRPGTHGFLLDGKRDIFTKVIYMSTFSILVADTAYFSPVFVFPVLKQGQ